MKKALVEKRYNLIVGFIKAHRGAENAVGNKEINAFLEDHGLAMKPRSIGKTLNKLMYDRWLPICFINGKGYYWASSKAEIERTINDLSSRVSELLRHIEHLRSFIMD